MRSSAWVTPPCPRLLKTFKICAQKKDLRSILPFDYTIDRSLSSRHFYTVYSCLPASRFHARMKICLQEGTKEAPLYEQKERWRSQRGKHRRCVFANGAVNCFVTSRDAAGRFHARMKICLQEGTKEAPLYEQKERWRSQRGKHRRCVFANGAVNCFVTSRDAAGRFHARMKICLQEDTKEAPLYEQKERWRSQRDKHRRCVFANGAVNCCSAGAYRASSSFTISSALRITLSIS